MSDDEITVTATGESPPSYYTTEKDEALLAALKAVAQQVGRSDMLGFLSGPTPLDNAIARFEVAMRHYDR